jgi:hypothetical protein
MAKTLLVSVDIEGGLALLRALDAAKIRVSVAVWVHTEEYSSWNLVLSSRQLYQGGYELVRRATDAAGMNVLDTPPIMILSMNDPFIRDLRRRYANRKDVEGMRLGGQMFGDRYVEDGYVYRIS